MHLIRLQRSITKFKKLTVRYYVQPALQDENEYTETPQYPPILDLSLKARKLRERDAVHEKIRKVKTIEEKQIALNMPRYYGFKCVIFNEDKMYFNALPLVQCYTRSHFIPMDKLPDVYSETEGIAGEVVKEIRGHIEDAIAFELKGVEYTFNETLEKPLNHQNEDAVTRCIVRQMNRIITNNLAEKTTHLLSAQVDYDPRHEAFWYVGGVDPPKSVIGFRKQFPWLKDRLNEPIDRPVQYLGSPLLTLRSNLPLRPILPYSDADNPSFKVPKFTYHPETVGYYTKYRHGTNIPGYWPGDSDEFGLLAIHGRGHILERKTSFGEQDNLEALHCQAMKASYGWLLAQASFQGFTTYNDITYPLATQTVITNGQLWSFYSYQLNTVLMHNEYIDENPKHNVCFGTQPLKLYDGVENGKVVGLNEDVLRMIVQFYMNAPEERDHEMKPYLGDEEQVIADIEDDNRRCWLEQTYKHIVSNRPRHLLPPEIYDWEKIYKIRFPTRAHEAKRRPFEFGEFPHLRKLNDHLPKYIPKVLRPYPRCRKKFETTYYPDV